MNAVWNLDPIYKGFDDLAFEGDMTALKEKVAEIVETYTIDKGEDKDGK